jgi:hypothetical protein
MHVEDPVRPPTGLWHISFLVSYPGVRNRASFSLFFNLSSLYFLCFMKM